MILEISLAVAILGLVGLTGIILTLIVILCLVARFAYKMARIVMEVEDAVEDALDTLDAHYMSISKILELPTFFDSLEVRQVLEDIDKSRSAVLFVANVLTEAVDQTALEAEHEEEKADGV